jgi:hypothetical protein
MYEAHARSLSVLQGNAPPPISIRCPSCGQNGTFESMGAWDVQVFDMEATPQAVRLGTRICPIRTAGWRCSSCWITRRVPWSRRIRPRSSTSTRRTSRLRCRKHSPRRSRVTRTSATSRPRSWFARRLRSCVRPRARPDGTTGGTPRGLWITGFPGCVPVGVDGKSVIRDKSLKGEAPPDFAEATGRVRAWLPAERGSRPVTLHPLAASLGTGYWIVGRHLQRSERHSEIGRRERKCAPSAFHTHQGRSR